MPSQLAEKLLTKDHTRIGVVYRYSSSGKTAQEIAGELGHSTTHNVIENLRVIDAILNGLNTSELTDVETAYLIAFVKRWHTELPSVILEWAKQAEEVLGGDLAPYFGLLRPASANKAGDREDTTSIVSHPTPLLAPAPPALVPGVYAYSYPSLITSSSFREEDPLLKIGSSGRLKDRLQQQTSKTEVPENLMLLWSLELPSKEDATLVEDNLHAILRLFGRWRKTTESGSEWFQVNTYTLDKLSKIVLGEEL